MLLQKITAQGLREPSAGQEWEGDVPDGVSWASGDEEMLGDTPGELCTAHGVETSTASFVSAGFDSVFRG